MKQKVYHTYPAVRSVLLFSKETTELDMCVFVNGDPPCTRYSSMKYSNRSENTYNYHRLRSSA